MKIFLKKNFDLNWSISLFDCSFALISSLKPGQLKLSPKKIYNI